MKVAVLGSNSFLAQDFIDLVLERVKGCSVIGFSRSSEKSLYLRYKNNKNIKKFNFYKLDISKKTDFEEIIAILDDFEPEYIINFISLTNILQSWENPIAYFDLHCVKLLELLDKLKDRTYLKRFIHTSSQAVYGSVEGRIDEHTVPVPSAPYGVSKLASDNIINLFSKKDNFIPFIILRLTNFYGQHQSMDKIVQKTVKSIKECVPLPLHGGGEAVLSYLHVRDVSVAIFNALQIGKLGSTYLIGPNKTVLLKELIGIIASEFHLELEDVVYNVSQRKGQNVSQWLDISRTKEELNWIPTIELEDGIKETVQWIENYYEELKKSETKKH